MNMTTSHSKAGTKAAQDAAGTNVKNTGADLLSSQASNGDQKLAEKTGTADKNTTSEYLADGAKPNPDYVAPTASADQQFLADGTTLNPAYVAPDTVDADGSFDNNANDQQASTQLSSPTPPADLKNALGGAPDHEPEALDVQNDVDAEIERLEALVDRVGAINPEFQTMIEAQIAALEGEATTDELKAKWGKRKVTTPEQDITDQKVYDAVAKAIEWRDDPAVQSPSEGWRTLL